MKLKRPKVKILISIPAELNDLINEYNKNNPYEPLHVSEIASKAINDKLKLEQE
jgi:hypothetical protein